MELTNTGGGRSGVWITTSARNPSWTTVPGEPHDAPVWNEPARAGDPPSFILRRHRFDAALPVTAAQLASAVNGTVVVRPAMSVG
jgi:hypothetical protein